MDASITTLTSRSPRQPADGQMSLRAHLTELRNRIVRALCWLVLGGSICLWQWEPIFHWLEAPLNIAKAGLPPDTFAGIATRQTQGGIVQVFRIATAGAVVLASPLLVLEIWGFVAPGLTKAEQRFTGALLPAIMLLFFLGCAFAYYVIFPPMVAFLLQFNARIVTFQPIEISEYLALILNLMLAMGVAFQIPIVSLILARLGLVTAAMLGRYRRHAMVGAAILAAVITPTPDGFNMMLLALPLYGLYEISVLVVWLAARPARTV